MTERSRLDLLVGKYFLAPFPHDEEGIVEAVIDDQHCLVRFEAGTDGRPEAFAVVALCDIVRAGNVGEDGEVPHWLFFDSPDQRTKYREWIYKSDEPNKPRIVYMRPKQPQ